MVVTTLVQSDEIDWSVTDEDTIVCVYYWSLHSHTITHHH